MSAARSTALAVVIALLAACEDASPPPDPAAGPATGAPSEAELVDAYRAAHESGDVESAMGLVYLEGVSEKLQQGFRRAFRTDFERELASVDLVDLTEPPLEEKTIGGRTYRANLRAVKELRVEFVRLHTPDGEISGRNYPVGIVNGRYRIGSTVVTDSPGRTAVAEGEERFVAAAGTVIDFLRGEAGFDALRLSDTVAFYLAPEGGGGTATVPAGDLRDRARWRIRSDRGLTYPLVPPAGASRLETGFGRHMRCSEQALEDDFPGLARLPHVGTRLAPPDMSSCLQSWNLTLVFEADTLPPRLAAVVYDQWEW